MARNRRRWYEWPERWRAFRHVPLRRLWILYTAVFLIFSIIGMFSELMDMGRLPYPITIAIGVICGLDAVLWLFMMNRLPWPTVFLAIALQFAMGPCIGFVARRMELAFRLTSPSPEAGIRFAAIGMLIIAIASYAFFVFFFNVEARETIRISNELELAHGIQKTLVPPISLCTERYELYGVSHPSDKVGGDLVDAVLLPNGDLIAYLADIAGHGLPAGILMGMLKTAAHTALLDATEHEPAASLPALLEKLNRVLPDVKEPQMYATLAAFRLNKDGSAWCAMAASPPVLHWRPCRNTAQLVQSEQFPLGLLPVSGFSGEPIDLRDGDLLVVATDGVLEVCDRSEQEFGMTRLEQSISTASQLPLSEMADSILAKARAFGKQADDQTLLLIRRRS
jgi:hypothetical protein